MLSVEDQRQRWYDGGGGGGDPFAPVMCAQLKTRHWVITDCTGRIPAACDSRDTLTNRCLWNVCNRELYATVALKSSVFHMGILHPYWQLMR
jgi:hypothetical protein